MYDQIMLEYGLIVLLFCLGNEADSIDGGCTFSGSGRPRFGDRCQYDCHCVNESEQCDVITGLCATGCDFKWVGPGCQFKNIAYGGLARHESNVRNPKYADLANDKSLKTCSLTSYRNTSEPWWNLWLPGNTTFKKLEFITTEDRLKHFLNFKVEVYNVTKEMALNFEIVPKGTLCYEQINSIPQDKKIQITCDGYPVGNLIRLQLKSNFSQLVLCDFRVYEDCKSGFYGNGCQNCSEYCVASAHRTCKSSDGSCLNGCKSGWRGDRCDRKCVPGYFGKDCKQQCNSTCSESGTTLCNNINGTCVNGCIAGYTGPYCEFVCKHGYYGIKCKRQCSITCLKSGNSSCNSINGTCVNGCIAGYTGPYCELECEDGKWGFNCQNDCGTCLSSSCNHVNGTCEEGCAAGYKATKECKTPCNSGYFGKDCKHLCNITCSNVMCNNVDGTCLNGCRDGYIGPYCEIDQTHSAARYVPNHYQVSIMKFVSIGLGILCVALILYATVITVLYKHKTTQNALMKKERDESKYETAITYTFDKTRESNHYTDLKPTDTEETPPYETLF